MKKDYKIDDRRIYATGHSNGGRFTFVLWANRGDVLAAVAPAASGGAVRNLNALKPKPALIIAGEKDEVVPFELQKASMEAVRKLDACDENGKEWAKNCTLYPSGTGTPVVTFIHPGGHSMPDASPELIVRFFQEHPSH